MGRRKAHWTARLSSYGPLYIKGSPAGFRVVVLADDGTDTGRYVDLLIDASSLRRIADRAAATEEAEEN